MFRGVPARARPIVSQALLAALMMIGTAAPARAQDGPELFTAQTLSASGDIRIVGVDGERGWLDGGDGKTRFGGGDPDGDFRIRPEPVEGSLIWQPRFTWSLSGSVVAVAQHGQDHAVDLSEAQLRFKPLLGGNARVSVRAGLFWPPVSLEHSGADWSVTDTVTPSAINSWIGDEVKVGGVETHVSTDLGGSRITATVAGFGLNDTSGTLIAFRGWALHDEKATAFGLQRLPKLDGMLGRVQAPRTDPVIEIDHRAGWYGKLGWSPGEAFELQIFHYDNRGDPTEATPGKQWGWRTRFSNLGALATIGPVELRAQALGGRTEMGFPRGGRLWVDTSFRSAFLLATRRFARGSASARIEAFGTKSRGSVADDEYSEHGWAFTLAARRDFGERFSLLGEFLHVESDRAARVDLGVAPHQTQNQLQLALRVHL